MAHCVNCGAQVSDNDRFCVSCGSVVLEQPEAATGETAVPSAPVTDVATPGALASTAADATIAVTAPTTTSAPSLGVDLIGPALGLAVGLVATAAFSVLIGLAARTEPFADYFFRLGDLAFAVPVVAGVIAGALVGGRDTPNTPTAGGPWPAAIASGLAAAGGLFLCAQAGGVFSGIVSSGFQVIVPSTTIAGSTIFVGIAGGAGFLGWKGVSAGRTLAVIGLGTGSVIIAVCAPALWRFYQLLSILARS